VHLVALCPTYGRPSLVRTALALFLGQALRPGDTAHLLIFADDGLLQTQTGGQPPLTWEVMTAPDWVPLTRKYAPMLAHAGHADAWVVWDDDDIYFSWHLQAHAAALQSAPWSHPTQAWSTYGGIHLRPLAHRHYPGALAVGGPLMAELGGWPKTDRSNYDQQMLAACHRTAGSPGDPCQHAPPSYVYRWQDSGRDHCSARIRDGRYQPPRRQELPLHPLTPHLDPAAAEILLRVLPPGPGAR